MAKILRYSIHLMFSVLCISAGIKWCFASYEEIDECILGLDNCDDNATCTNTIGSFTCTCNVDFFGDGTNCSL